jgi:hypothetical protein
MEQVQLALDNSNEKPDVIYLTGERSLAVD